MRLRILTLLCYLTVLVLATGRLEDKSDIEDLQNALPLFTDAKKFEKSSELFTLNVTFDPGPGYPVRPIQGRPAILDYLRKLIPPNVSSFGQVGTELIKFNPPFDKEGRSDRAEAIIYVTYTFSSTSNNSTETEIFFIRLVDKEIVRTKEPGFGGWRVQNRKLEIVGKPIGNTAIQGE